MRSSLGWSRSSVVTGQGWMSMQLSCAIQTTSRSSRATAMRPGRAAGKRMGVVSRASFGARFW